AWLQWPGTRPVSILGSRARLGVSWSWEQAPPTWRKWRFLVSSDRNLLPRIRWVHPISGPAEPLRGYGQATLPDPSSIFPLCRFRTAGAPSILVGLTRR